MKKLSKLLLVAVLSIFGLTSIHAATFTDMKSAKYEFVVNGEDDIRNPLVYDLAITGATFQSGSTYYVYFAHSKDTEVNVNTSGYVKATYVSSGALKVDEETYEAVTDALEKAGSIYVWVKEVNGDEPSIIASAVEVSRPSLAVNRRFATQFQYEATTITSRLPGVSNYNGRTVTYKMGRVTDLSLILSLKTTDKTEKAKAYQNLYNYAKNDANPYKTGTLSFGRSESITKYMLDLVDDAYYYVYIEYTDATGTYYSFDGVELYQALNCALNPNLNDPDMDTFKWPNVCVIKDGKYYGKDGTEVDESTYNSQCNPTEEKKVCKVEDNKYYGKDGTEVDEDTYKSECANVCKVVDDKYYGKDGTEVDKETYESECTTPENPKCEIKDGKYYDKDGNAVEKDVYEESCGTTENPKTAVNYGLGIAFLLIVSGFGVYTVVRKKNKFPQA